MKRLIALLLLICLPAFSLAETPSGSAFENELTGTNLPENISVLTGTPKEAPAEEPVFAPYVPEGVERAIIRSDDRVTIADPSDYPYSAIAYMIVHCKCGCSGTGTGFMVDKNMALTASHVLVCPIHHEWADTIDFYFGHKNARNYLYHYSGAWYAWVSDFPFEDDTSLHAWANDYGFIRFEDANPGDRTGWFGMTSPQISDGESAFYNLAGYRDGVLKWDYDRMILDYDVYVHYIDMLPGNSGCPIFTSDYYAVGINVAENEVSQYNLAAPITRSMIDDLLELSSDY